VRPHDTRIAHAIHVAHAALRDPAIVPQKSLTSLAILLGEAADDIRRWADGDRFVCERAVAAACVACSLVLALLHARAGDRVRLATDACSLCRKVAEAALVPSQDVRADLVLRARRIACEPNVEEWQAWMSTGGEG
jgi:hypothetical protein